MRLLFNATNLRSAGGVIILEQLLPHLLAYREPDQTGQPPHILLYHNPELTPRIAATLNALPPEAQARVEPVPLREPDGLRRFYWEQVTLPQIIRKRRVDTLFSFGNTGPLAPGCRQILYLQQSIPFSAYRPARHALRWIKFQWLYGLLINLAQLGSERIVVPTTWLVAPMRKAIWNMKPPQAYRVSLPGIPPWPEQPGRLDQNETELLQQLAQWRATGGKVLLYPCYLAPYKNIPALLEALCGLEDSTAPVQLVLTFNQDSQEYFPCKDEVLAAVQQCRETGKAVFLAGALNRPTLAEVYRLTDVLVFPSLVETLGLPLLEAMAQGIPIVALDGQPTSGDALTPPTAMAAFAREICRDAALYAPPNQPKALSEQIQRLLNDPALAQMLSRNGLNRASHFSWTEHARQILTIS